jgi:hypothetical protein
MINILIFHCVSSRLVNLFKLICVCVCDIFVLNFLLEAQQIFFQVFLPLTSRLKFFRVFPYFGLDSATIAILPSAFYGVLLSKLHETMIYAFSAHNIIDFLWMKFLYSL